MLVSLGLEETWGPYIYGETDVDGPTVMDIPASLYLRAIAAQREWSECSSLLNEYAETAFERARDYALREARAGMKNEAVADQSD